MDDARRSCRIAFRRAVMVTSHMGCLAVACTGSIEADPTFDVAAGGADQTSDGSVARAAPAMPKVDAGMDPVGAAGSAGAAVPSRTMGVGGRANDPASVPAQSFCDAVTEVLLPSCGGGSCHSNPSAGIGDWAVGRAEAESFVDVPSVRNAMCGFIIDSKDPAESLLLRKLVGDFPVPMCGGPMPVSGPDLTDEQISCMASWLQQFRR